MSRATVITVAKHLSTISESHKVIVLREGEMVEFDTPTTLMQDQMSEFAVVRAGL